MIKTLINFRICDRNCSRLTHYQNHIGTGKEQKKKEKKKGNTDSELTRRTGGLQDMPVPGLFSPVLDIDYFEPCT